MYSSAHEFISYYLDNKLNKYNTKLMNDYVEYNFSDKHFYEENVDIKYVDGCFCYLDDIENCECEDKVYYYYDDFMLNKIPMFPKNTYFQKYYENIFPKRIFDTKIFYYLPNDCKKISIRYIDETTNDISRTITYYFINNSIALIRDQLDGWFGNIYNHYHTLESEKINDYMEILNNYNIHSDNINIIKY
jgi:hypothetical protein